MSLACFVVHEVLLLPVGRAPSQHRAHDCEGQSHAEDHEDHEDHENRDLRNVPYWGHAYGGAYEVHSVLKDWSNRGLHYVRVADHCVLEDPLPDCDWCYGAGLAACHEVPIHESHPPVVPLEYTGLVAKLERHWPVAPMWYCYRGGIVVPEDHLHLEF